jgi:replicative DNA helicase
MSAHPASDGPSPRNIGAAPPHNLEAEQSVLGAILLSERTMHAFVIDEGVEVGDFYSERHREIFAAMIELYSRGTPIDVVTVRARLLETGKLQAAGGDAAVDMLVAPVPNAGNLRQYAQIVRENALLRRLLAATQEIQAQVLNQRQEPRDIVEQAEKAMLEVAHDKRKREFKVIRDVLSSELNKLEELSRRGSDLTGTPSGFKDLDAITGGFQPGNLVVLAARPGMGKSSLVTNMAEKAAVDHKRPVALFSLEMSEAELAQRFIASQASIHGDDLRKGRVDAARWPKIVKASSRLAEAPLYIDDSGDVTLLDIRAKSRRLHSQLREEHGGLGMIIVDYLQLMQSDRRIDNRAEAVAEMSRGLKLLARELEVPVIALSQLNRKVEERHDKRPMLSDLRESGAVEQDADVVIFIYRDEYYNEDSEREGEADLIIAKHRNGALDTVTLSFNPRYPRFMNYARSEMA